MAIIFAGFYFALTELGIDPMHVILGLGVFSMAVSIGAAATMGDLFHGLALLSERNNSVVKDKFTTIDEGNADQLSPILEYMTINRHILVGPKDRTIFVEGITDYNYLVMFKKILIGEDDKNDFSNLRFIPINGLANGKIADVLKKIERQPILLVDGDKAGKDFKKKNDDVSMVVFSLDEFDKEFKTIEDLFEEEDKKLLGLDGEDRKEFNRSSVLKNNYSEYSDKISEKTKENFQKVLKGPQEDV